MRPFGFQWLGRLVQRLCTIRSRHLCTICDLNFGHSIRPTSHLNRLGFDSDFHSETDSKTHHRSHLAVELLCWLAAQREHILHQRLSLFL